MIFRSSNLLFFLLFCGAEFTQGAEYIDVRVSTELRQTVDTLAKIVMQVPPSGIAEAILRSSVFAPFLNGPDRSALVPMKIVIGEQKIREIVDQVSESKIFLTRVAIDQEHTNLTRREPASETVESNNSYLFILPILNEASEMTGNPVFSSSLNRTMIPGDLWIQLDDGNQVLIEQYPLEDKTRRIIDDLRRWITFEEVFHTLEKIAKIEENLTLYRPLNNLLQFFGLPAVFNQASPFYMVWQQQNGVEFDPYRRDKVMARVAPGIDSSDLSMMSELIVYRIGKSLLPELFKDPDFEQMIINNHPRARLPQHGLVKMINSYRDDLTGCNAFL